MTMYELQRRVAKEMKLRDIDTDYTSSSLYLRKNETSTAIVSEYDYKSMVTQFVDAIDHEVWYEIPFAKFPYMDMKQIETLKKLNE